MFNRKLKISKDELEQRGRSLTPMLYLKSKELADDLSDASNAKVEIVDNHLLLFNYCCTIYYFYAGLKIFEKYGSNKRGVLMGSTENTLIQMTGHNYKLNQVELDKESESLTHTNRKLAPYAMNWIQEGDENPKGTMLWEFYKALSECGVGLLTAMRVTDTIFDGMKSIQKLIKRF